MFEIASTAYEFPCPPDYHWLPSSFSLFEDDGVSADDALLSESMWQRERLIVIHCEPERRSE